MKITLTKILFLGILFTLLSLTAPIEIAAITLLVILLLVYAIYIVIMETIQEKESESELFYSLIIVLSLPIFLQVKGIFCHSYFQKEMQLWSYILY